MKPWRLVVHIGAGTTSTWQPYEAADCSKLLLIEGDPDAAADLAFRLQSQPPSGTELLAHAVAARSGPLPWLRYNLPSLNGPVEASDLQGLFPRLRALESTEVRAKGIVEVLAPYLQALAEGPAMLVCDVPGQESELLSALDGELLRRFARLQLRMRRDPRQVEALTTWLARQGFAPSRSNRPDDPVWHQLELVYDETCFARAQLSVLQERLGRSEAQLRHTEAKWREEHAAASTGAERLNEERAALASRVAELEAELAHTREQCAREAAARSDALRELQQAKAASEQQTQAVESRMNERVQGLERALKELEAAQQAERAAMAAQMAALDTDLAAAREASARHAAARADLQRELDETQAAAELRALTNEARLNEQAKSLERTLKGLEETHQSERAALTARVASLDADLATTREINTRHAAAQADIQRKFEEARVLDEQRAQAAEARMNDRVQALENALKEREAAHQAELQRRQQAHEEQLHERELEIGRDLQSREQALQSQVRALQTSVKSLEQDRQLAAADAQARHAELTERERSLEEQAQRAAAEAVAQRSACAELARQHEASSLLASERQRTIVATQSALDQCKANLAAAETRLAQELKEARQQGALSVKLQLLREADLRDLQARHAQLQAQQQSQSQLLAKLAERLTLANEQFRQLSVGGARRADEAIAQDAPRSARKRALPAPADR